MKQIAAAVLAFALCGAPELIQAQQSVPAPPPAANSNAEDQQAPAGTNGQTQPAPPSSAPASSPAQKTRGVTVDPSQGPLEPVPAMTPLPPDSAEPVSKPATAPADSSSETTPPAGQQGTQNLPANPQPQSSEEPVGAAAAEKGRTAGGAASKPAGTAIAPAKQGQMRSWLIRIGAIAAAGAAFGTVYALSHKTPSTPPGVQTLGTH
jgi:hypothetical protein